MKLLCANPKHNKPIEVESYIQYLNLRCNNCYTFLCSADCKKNHMSCGFPTEEWKLLGKYYKI